MAALRRVRDPAPGRGPGPCSVRAVRGGSRSPRSRSGVRSAILRAPTG
ncbi:hypothetical protein SSCG_03933 [Streptomyces clavuligerus]|nr:hypothetical protein SSCG_03933 [Streptomyces clavuligerus]